ncbi:MAG: alpha/beta hydrolase [Bacteroidota bacterium]|nr:alpha/beta hydrolase [Bacteroidota bacterium]
MKSKIKTLLVITFFSTHLLFAQNVEKKFVIIDKVKTAYKTFGLENRKGNEPVLVFESGMGGGSFEQIFEYLPKNVAGIEYGRNGLGESEIDTTIKTDVHVIERLHKLLLTLEIKPPYLLVGHSLGGPFIRLYTSIYPNEVCGLVFVDPTDFMLTKDEDKKVKKSTSSLTGYRDIWTINLKAMSTDTAMPLGIRIEAKRELASSTPFFFKEYSSLPPLKNIPVAVLISYNKPIEFYETEMNKKLKLGINLVPWWKELDNLRIVHYADMIKKNQDSRIILLPGYSHGIHYQDPKLVADAVSDIYNNCLKPNKN